MIQVCLLLFVAGLTFGGAGMNWWRTTLIKAEESRRIAAEQKLAEQTAKAIEEGKNKLIDMQAAFEAGQAKAKTIYKTVYAKGQEYVRTIPAFSNPVCVIDDPRVMQQLNSQIAAMHAAAAASVLGIAVPGAGADSGGQTGDGRPLSPILGQPRADESLPGKAEEPARVDPVPGQGVQRPPKPKPIN